MFLILLRPSSGSSSGIQKNGLNGFCAIVLVIIADENLLGFFRIIKIFFMAGPS